MRSFRETGIYPTPAATPTVQMASRGSSRSIQSRSGSKRPKPSVTRGLGGVVEGMQEGLMMIRSVTAMRRNRVDAAVVAGSVNVG